MSSTVLQSAYLIPLPDLLDIDPVGDGTYTPLSDPAQPLEDSDPNVRPTLFKYVDADEEQARIDLFIAQLIQQTSFIASEIWNEEFPTIGLPFLPTGVYDHGSLAVTPALITFLESQVKPLSFQDINSQITTRDETLLEALAITSKIFPSRLRQVTSKGGTVDNAWATVDAAGDGGHFTQNRLYYDTRYGKFVRTRKNISLQDALDQNMFKLVDMNGIRRDNILAGWIAKINYRLLNIYETAQRLLVRSTGAEVREPEVYVLITENDDQRVFVPDPALPGGRSRLTYNRRNATIRFTGENTVNEINVNRPISWGIPEIAPTNPLNFDGPIPGQNISIIPDLPRLYDATAGYGVDAQWWRQKSKRLNFESSKSLRKQWKIVSDTNSAPGAPSAAVILDAMEPGTWEVNLKVRPIAPSRFYSIPAEGPPCEGKVHQTVGCVSSDDDITFTLSLGDVSATATASIIPNRVDVLRFILTLPVGYTQPRISLATSGFFYNVTQVNVEEIDVRHITTVDKLGGTSVYAFSGWNGECLDRAVEGMGSSYKKVLGTYALYPEFRLVHINSGQEVQPFSLRPNYSECDYTYQANNFIVLFASDCPYVAGDFVVFTSANQLPVLRQVLVVEAQEDQWVATLNATLGAEDRQGGSWAKGALAFSLYQAPDRIEVDNDTGIVSGTASSVQQNTVYTFTAKVRGVVNGDQTMRAKVFSTSTPSPIPDSPFEWDQTSTQLYMTAMQSVEKRLSTSLRSNETNQDVAFRTGKPGDIGAPCIVPSTLQYSLNEAVIGHYGAEKSFPVIRVFQPWMLDSGIYVVQDDWTGAIPTDCNQSDELVGCQSYAVLDHEKFNQQCAAYSTPPRDSTVSWLLLGPASYGQTTLPYATNWTVSNHLGTVKYAKATSQRSPFAPDSQFQISTLFAGKPVLTNYITAAFDTNGYEVVAFIRSDNQLEVRWYAGGTPNSLVFSGVTPSLFFKGLMNPLDTNTVLYYLKSETPTVLYSRIQAEGFATEHVYQTFLYPITELIYGSKIGLYEELFGYSACGRVMTFSSIPFNPFS